MFYFPNIVKKLNISDREQPNQVTKFNSVVTKQSPNNMSGIFSTPFPPQDQATHKLNHSWTGHSLLIKFTCLHLTEAQHSSKRASLLKKHSLD